MWLTVLKSALVAFIVIGIAVLAITYVRRSPKVKIRQEPDGSLQTRWVIPPTPLPEWAYWTDDDDEGRVDSR
ncbi:hypothetical protein JOF57_000839 [Mycolicibacterium lutetiense]|uniref:Secreted protein n=1 Tax=Mycolicibacterium lutetiense TaxID=1641992 RepID=A0ABS4ZQP8_9MYCO|nr:hypothetical protein [Mycolicibacterium lutetiense]